MKRALPAIAVLYLLIYWLPLGVRPLAIPDETRYAEIPREMIETGDWVVPRLNGLRYFEKPVMGYWANALSIQLLGPRPFAVRLPTALATGLSAVMVFFLVRVSLGRTRALLAAAVYLTSILVAALGTLSLLDGLLTGFLTAGMALFFLGSSTPTPARKGIFLALSGAAFAAAFLTKGFLAFAVPALALVPYALWDRKWRRALRSAWIPAVAALVVILPWSLRIHFQAPDFWPYFIWTEHIQRFLSPLPGQHPKPPWFFLPILAGGLLPWIFLAPAAVRGLMHRGLQDSLVRFALCWLVFPFLFFSACSGKLIPYILPCIPPAAVLLAVGLVDQLEAGHGRAFFWGSVAAAMCLGAAGLVMLWESLGIGDSGFGIYGPHELSKGRWAALALAAWAAVCAIAAGNRNRTAALALWCAAPVLFLASTPWIIPHHATADKTPVAFLKEQADAVSPADLLVADNDLVHAVCWAYGRRDVSLFDKSGELTFGLQYPDAAPQRLYTPEEFAGWVTDPARTRPVVLITTQERFERTPLPRPGVLEQKDGFVWARYDGSWDR